MILVLCFLVGRFVIRKIICQNFCKHLLTFEKMSIKNQFQLVFRSIPIFL